MRLDPELERLGAELARAGHIVVPHGDHLCVRLAFFSSVRIRLRDGTLRLEHRFGTISREWSVVSSIATFSAVTAAWFTVAGPGPIPFSIAFVGIVLTIFDAMRVAVSEGAATRVQLAWSMLRRPGAHSQEPALAPSTPAAALPGASPLAAGGERVAAATHEARL